MLVLVHVIIALSGLVSTGISFFSPSKSKINISYALVVATIVSGTALVIIKNANLVSACITGLLYLGVALSGIIAAQRKLAKETSEN